MAEDGKGGKKVGGTRIAAPVARHSGGGDQRPITYGQYSASDMVFPLVY